MTHEVDKLTAILDGGGIANAAVEATRIADAARRLLQDADSSEVARSMAHRRASGVPLGYIIGREFFLGIELIVGEGALAPRQETELLGQTAIETLRLLDTASPRVIDMCCGSGNLACAMAHHVPQLRVWASDLTDGCIALSRQNIEHVGVADRVIVAQGDLFGGLNDPALGGSIDLVVCNPPYISQAKLATERAQLLDHEPREAFDGGPYGLSIQQRVVTEALPFLKPGGHLMFEIGLGQERQVKMLFDRTKAYEDIRLVANSAGQIQVVSGRKRGKSAC